MGTDTQLIKYTIKGDIKGVKSRLGKDDLEAVSFTRPYAELTALGIAVLEGNRKIVKLLLQDGAKPISEFFLFLRNFDIEIGKMLITYGADVNGFSKTGEVVIVVMAESACLNGVKLLFYNGADVNKVNKDNEFTALMLAAQNFSQFNTKADPNKVNPVLEFLVEKGADVNARNDILNTALHFAARYDSSYFNVKYLISHGVDIDAQNSIGGTALMQAVATEQKDIVELLLSSGADPTLKDEEGNTAYQMILKPEKQLRVVENGEVVDVFENSYYEKEKEVSEFQRNAFHKHGINT